MTIPLGCNGLYRDHPFSTYAKFSVVFQKIFKYFNIGKHCRDIQKTCKKCPHLGENKKKIKEPSNNKAISKANQKTDALKMKKHCIKLD